MGDYAFEGGFMKGEGGEYAADAIAPGGGEGGEDGEASEP